MKILFKIRGRQLCPPEFSLKMKLTTILLFIALFNIRANNYAQNTRISLDLKEVSIEKVLNEIEAHTEFKFLYNLKDVDISKLVTLKVNKEKVRNILQTLFLNTNVSYEVLDKHIILKRNEKKYIKSVPIKSDTPVQSEVQGIVKDSDGIILAGANVVIKGTTKGVVTDFDGYFSIAVPNSQTVLVFSYIGMETKEVVVGNNTNLDVVMDPSAQKNGRGNCYRTGNEARKKSFGILCRRGRWRRNELGTSRKCLGWIE